MAQAVPTGYRTLTPSFTLKDTKKALAFYQMGDEMPGSSCKSAETLGSSPISLYLYVPNADAAFKQAVAAGCKVTMPLADMFWGDRAGNVQDPFGYSWMIATHTQDLSPEQVRKGAEAFFAQMAKK